MTTQPLSALTMLLSRHTRRREFIALMVAASSYASPFAALAQVPTTRPRITYIGGSGPKPSAKVTGAFIEGMRALGYTEGRDFEMEYRWAEGYLERLPALAEESVRRGSDVIVVANPQAAVAAKDATETIPIVGALLDDPVGLGLIKSDARPGGNLTGLLTSVPGLPAKQLELARDLIPGATRIGLLVNPTNVSDLNQRREMETAAATMAVTLIRSKPARRKTSIRSSRRWRESGWTSSSRCGTRFFSLGGEHSLRRHWRRDCLRSTHGANLSMTAA